MQQLRILMLGMALLAVEISLAQTLGTETGKLYFETFMIKGNKNPYANNQWVFLLSGKDTSSDIRAINRLIPHADFTRIAQPVDDVYSYEVIISKQFNTITLTSFLEILFSRSKRYNLKVLDFGIQADHDIIYYASKIKSPYYGSSATTLNGIVKDHYYSGIPYANIKVGKKGVGTIADEYGSFKIDIPNRFLADTLIIIAPGYQTQYTPISTIPTHTKYTSVLSDIHFADTDFSFDSAASSDEYLGRLSKGKFRLLPPFTESGGQVAKVFFTDNLVKYSAVYFFFQVKEDFPVKLRLRIYEFDTIQLLPGAEITVESIIQEPNFTEGWICFDVESYGIITNRPIVFGVEWLDNSFNSVLIGGDKPTQKVDCFMKMNTGYDWTTDQTYDWSMKCRVKKVTKK